MGSYLFIIYIIFEKAYFYNIRFLTRNGYYI